MLIKYLSFNLVTYIDLKLHYLFIYDRMKGTQNDRRYQSVNSHANNMIRLGKHSKIHAEIKNTHLLTVDTS